MGRNNNSWAQHTKDTVPGRKRETWVCNITPGLIANQWSWWGECGGDNNRLGLPYINHSCTVPNTNHSRCTNKSSGDVIIPQQKKSIICHWGLWYVYIDWWLNLNAITYLAASSRKRDYFVLLRCAYVRKYPLSVGQERKMPVICRKPHWRSKGDWMQRQRRLNSDVELCNCPGLLIFPLWRLSGQWLSSFGPCSVIMVSLCDSRRASAAAKGQKVLLCLDICWEKSELSFSLAIWFSSQRPSLSFLYLPTSQSSVSPVSL